MYRQMGEREIGEKRSHRSGDGETDRKTRQIKRKTKRRTRNSPSVKEPQM